MLYWIKIMKYSSKGIQAGHPGKDAPGPDDNPQKPLYARWPLPSSHILDCSCPDCRLPNLRHEKTAEPAFSKKELSFSADFL